MPLIDLNDQAEAVPRPCLEGFQPDTIERPKVTHKEMCRRAVMQHLSVKVAKNE
jgi:hypothetical protein